MGNIKMRRALLVVAIIISSISCSLDGVAYGNDERILDHSYVKSRSGAIGVYYSSVASLRNAFSLLSRDVAFFTDEIQAIPTPDNMSIQVQPELARMDSRNNAALDMAGGLSPRFGNDLYQYINEARIRSVQARQLLNQYGDSLTQALLANTYSVEAYAVLFLAENGCSGIPLTYIPFEGSVEYTEGYTTTELFHKAAELFDSAALFDHDSLYFYTLAAVGKGRAYLGLGRLDSASLAVREVHQGDPSFVLAYTDAFTPRDSSRETRFWTFRDSSHSSGTPVTRVELDYVFIENSEGNNGIDWVASTTQLQDPRIPVEIVIDHGRPFPQQRKFIGGGVRVTLASWIDARMVQAEALLNQDGLSGTSWLVPLNEARRSIGLPDTTDPGSSDARVDLLFRERAFWFYLTGSRLGDMRRLVRQYGRRATSVYPYGPYTKVPQTSAYVNMQIYGDYFVFAPPADEYTYNYKYAGCEHYNP